MQGRFRSIEIPEFTREVPDPAPHKYVIDGRAYKLTLETGGSDNDVSAVYDEVPASK